MDCSTQKIINSITMILTRQMVAGKNYKKINQ